MYYDITLGRILIALVEIIGVEIAIFFIAKLLQGIGQISDIILGGSILGIIPSVIMGAVYGFKIMVMSMIICIVIWGIIISYDYDSTEGSSSNSDTFFEELGIIWGLHMIEKSYKENEKNNNKKDEK